MLRRILVVAACALGVALGFAVLRDRVEGSGNRAAEEREVGEITEVVLSGVGDLTVTPGEVTELVVSADDNILPLLETNSSGGTLTLRTKSGVSLAPKTPITYALRVPRLDRLTVSGAGNAAVEGPVGGDDLGIKVSGAGDVKLRGLACRGLTVTLSGAGNVTAAGTADRLTAKVSGAGDIKAADLKATAADVHISGAGNVTVWATGDLKARVTGAGDVKYKGQPRVDQKVSGAGSIKPAGG
jgi:hypothetical protein